MCIHGLYNIRVVRTFFSPPWSISAFTTPEEVRQWKRGHKMEKALHPAHPADR
jgi:hypothetical protein